MGNVFLFYFLFPKTVHQSPTPHKTAESADPSPAYRDRTALTVPLQPPDQSPPPQTYPHNAECA
ncbi:MAG: hypothetical protein ACSI46_24845 [Gloeotrichia echinulata DVL01]|nr:hypothetical protein [Gloeotrichia echinulata DEX184]